MPEQQPTREHPEKVIGRFATSESARAAMVRLEAAGFDGDAVSLEDVAPAVAPSDVASEHDLETTGDVAKGAGVGGAIGTAAGVAAGVVTGLVTGDMGTGAIVGTVGAVGAGAVGGLAGTYAGLPANPEAWETYELDPSDAHPVTVAVRVDSPEQAATARDLLRNPDAPNPPSSVT